MPAIGDTIVESRIGHEVADEKGVERVPIVVSPAPAEHLVHEIDALALQAVAMLARLHVSPLVDQIPGIEMRFLHTTAVARIAPARRLSRTAYDKAVRAYLASA